jgi:acetyl-CoA synthetase
MHEAVAECAAVGMPDAVKGETVWVVVVVKPHVDIAEQDLGAEIRTLVREHLGGSFAPARVVVVPALPKTRSAKIVRRAVRAALTDEDPGDVSTLEDPDVIEAIGRAASSPRT